MLVVSPNTSLNNNNTKSKNRRGRICLPPKCLKIIMDLEKLAYTVGLFILSVMALFGLILYSCWASAFVATVLWGWFIVPVFGLVQITIAQAFGISLILALWTKSLHREGSKDERSDSGKLSNGLQYIWFSTAEKVRGFLFVLLIPWILLFFGWICKHFFL